MDVTKETTAKEVKEQTKSSMVYFLEKMQGSCTPGSEGWESYKEVIERYEDSLVVDYDQTIGMKFLPTTHFIKHPLIQHKIDIMRGVDVKSLDFRRLIEEVTMMLCYEATRELPLEEYEVVTPICKTVGKKIAGKKLVWAPIMRAGLGMEYAAKELVPSSRTGHIGLFRDEVTLEPQEYFVKMPNEVNKRHVMILDPMLATGGSADAAIKKLKDKGCDTISFICVIAAPIGIKLLQDNHPDVELYIGYLDKGLNEDGYIVPGLGDAGDRIFGTK